MVDAEKVIKGLECCTRTIVTYEPRCTDCPYYDGNSKHCIEQTQRDALELLKEQEPVKPNKSSLSMNDGFMWVIYDCGFCGSRLRGPANYCDRCGKKVKWDD